MFFRFFDKLEDNARSRLSKNPILYAFLSGVGTVLFYRGVWMIADDFGFMTGPVTLVISLAILLITGVFVFHFVSDQIIISGLKKEKKLIEKTEEEIGMETITLKEIHALLQKIEKRLGEFDIKT
ncbi:MAG: hypothetical protein Q7S78_00660 [Candidatus Azambacteria bacterium]|nr:hypothetical protein [Candidatus Azambacteria bacterium]